MEKSGALSRFLSAMILCLYLRLTPLPYIYIWWRFGRGTFQEVTKLARKLEVTEAECSKFKFMVFDVPNFHDKNATYAERYQYLGKWLSWLVIVNLICGRGIREHESMQIHWSGTQDTMQRQCPPRRILSRRAWQRRGRHHLERSFRSMWTRASAQLP